MVQDHGAAEGIDCLSPQVVELAKSLKVMKANDRRCPLWLAGPLVNCIILGAHCLPQQFGKRRRKE